MLNGGGSSVMADSIVTIDVIADWAVSLNAGFNLMQSTTSSAGNATALAVGTLNAGFDQIAVNGNLCNVQSGSRFILIDRINGVIADGSPPIAAGDALYSFDLVIPELAAVGETFTIDDAFGSPVVNPGPDYGARAFMAAGMLPTFHR